MTFNQIRLVKRILAILLVCGMAIVGYHLFLGMESETTSPTAELLSESEEATARGVDITRLDEDGEQVFELRAAESVGRSEDTQTFRDVEITFQAGQSGEIPLVVTGDLCRYNTVDSTVHLEGNVVVTDAEGLRIETSTLDYGPKPKRVWSDNEVRFSRGGLAGEAGRLVYQVVGNAFELDGGVDMTFTPEEGPPVEVTSESARIRRRDKFVRFLGNVHVSQDTRRLTSDHLQIHLTDDEKGLTGIDADGNVRMVLEVPPENGPTEEDASPFEQPGRKRLSAKRVEFFFRPDGNTIREMVATGDAKLAMLPVPSGGETPGVHRELEGSILTFQFDLEERLVALTGQGSVALTLLPEKGAPEDVRRLTARRMRSQFDPETGEVRQARTYESVTFRQGDLNGEAELGVYSAKDELLTLTESPRLWDDRSELTADKVEIHVVTGGLEATGDVRSRMLVTESTDGIGFLPGSEDEPVYFVSHRLQYHREQDLAVYTGSARGFRGENRLEAERIELVQKEGKLSASESVRTTLVQKSTSDEKAPPQLTFTSAQEVLYRAEDNLLSYAKDVEMRSGEIVLRGDKVDVSLAEGGGSVRQIDAAGNAEIVSTTGRARGEKATYVPEREEVRVSGERATLEDGDKLTEGKELTFFLSNDKIFIDGQEERRTKTTYSRSRPF
jgi:LPS export ABC transporter protein LptC/lipopolysaccharide transport protein LptA